MEDCGVSQLKRSPRRSPVVCNTLENRQIVWKNLMSFAFSEVPGQVFFEPCVLYTRSCPALPLEVHPHVNLHEVISVRTSVSFGLSQPAFVSSVKKLWRDNVV